MDDAGSGIVHSEMPTAAISERGPCTGSSCGSTCAPDKMTSPRYQGFDADELGSSTRRRQPAARDRRRVAGVRTGRDDVAGHVRTRHCAGDTIEWDVVEGHTALVHVFVGAADVNGTSAEEGQLVELDHDAGRVVVGSENGAEVLLLGGEPLREPIARYGPFVMNTRNEIVLAVEDFTEGRLGSIPADGSGVVRS